MIAAEDELTVEWLDANDVCFGDAQPCDLGKAEFYRGLMAEGPEGAHIAPPIVSPDRDVPGRFFLRDGKHRFLAQLALGRARIRCLVVTEAPPISAMPPESRLINATPLAARLTRGDPFTTY